MEDNLKNENNLINSKEFNLLFNLLEKAEQILSIINLSDSSISKYNTLKKLTFEMLNIEYKPLEKKYITPLTPNNQNNLDNNIQTNNNDTLFLLYYNYIKKSMLIDLLINFITNYNNDINEEHNINNYLNSLNEIYNLSEDIVDSKNINDIIYEIKSEESKIPTLFNNIDQIIKNNYETMKNMQSKYENELLQIKDNYEKEIYELKNNIGNNKKFDKEKNFNKSNKVKNEDNNFYLEKINIIIDESYEKYKQNYSNKNNSKSIAFKDGKLDENIFKLEFVKKVFDDYSNKNKSLNINNFAYSNNVFGPNSFAGNNLIEDICLNLPEIQKDSDDFHKNFNDLMNYISTNIEGKII